MTNGDAETRAAGMARRLIERLIEKRLTLALAESCTAGLVSDLLARTSGASAALWGSVVCYSPDAKRRLLGIDDGFLKKYGLVSRETVRAMADSVLNVAGVSVAAAVTGLAGPEGDGSDTPVGTVWIATSWSKTLAVRGNGGEKELRLRGTRAEIRMQAAAAVLEELFEALNEKRS